ncbi:MAG: hypothetical protein E6I27_08335 [Chloroflexi bacterium]|nr:MAG: hypothetical protein E6I27_08335 [Chloroflexota bacterium]
MPIPFMADDDRNEIANQLERIAGLVKNITAEESPPNPHEEMASIRDRLRGIGDALEEGTIAHGVTRDQIHTIAAHFEGIGGDLRKGSGAK